LWFNHEAFSELLDWMLTIAVVEIAADVELAPHERVQQIACCCQVIEALQRAEEASEYRVTKLVEEAGD
jgi:hypothetical protein